MDYSQLFDVLDTLQDMGKEPTAEKLATIAEIPMVHAREVVSRWNDGQILTVNRNRVTRDPHDPDLIWA